MSEMITIKKSEYENLVGRVERLENAYFERTKTISDEEVVELNKLDSDKVIDKKEIEELLV